ncbi:MAG: CDP-alcohol phosphatidyltransferase family protein [Devosiaceae bacterium]
MIAPEQPITLSTLAALSLYGLAVLLVGFGLSRTYPHARLGLCNIVTLTRLVIVAALAGALLSGLDPSWPIFLLAALALSLDGVDGWLARRQNLSSAFGARFDMEVDAAFALMLALLAGASGSAGPYVILLGLPHYIFLVAKFLLPWLGGALPDRYGRKVVCVAQLATLIALQLPFAISGSIDLVIIMVALALAWSFGRDILWLWRSRS